MKTHTVKAGKTAYLICGYEAESFFLLPAMPFPCLPSPASGEGGHGEGRSSLLLRQDTSVPTPHTIHNPKEFKKKSKNKRTLPDIAVSPKVLIKRFCSLDSSPTLKKNKITLTRKDDSQFCQSQPAFKIACLPYSKQVSFPERHLKPARFKILAFT